MTPSGPSPAPELVEQVVAALGRLAALGETIADEWTYVHDLETVWSARLRAVGSALPGPAGAATAIPAAELETAIAELVNEADRVTDPHRAIDWLSTLPAATLVALGEPAW